jgi:hypothetical protein
MRLAEKLDWKGLNFLTRHPSRYLVKWPEFWVLSFTWQTLRPPQILTLFFLMAKPPLVGQGLLITEAFRSHLDTLHVVRLLWTSDQPETQTSIWHTQHPQETSMTPAGFEPTLPASEHPQTQRPLWSLILMLITIPLLIFLLNISSWYIVEFYMHFQRTFCLFS